MNKKIIYYPSETLPEFVPLVKFGDGENTPLLSRIKNRTVTCGVTAKQWTLTFGVSTWVDEYSAAINLYNEGVPDHLLWRLDKTSGYNNYNATVFIGTLKTANILIGNVPNMVPVSISRIPLLKQWAKFHIDGEFSFESIYYVTSNSRGDQVKRKSVFVLSEQGLAMWMLATDYHKGDRLLPDEYRW